MARMVGELIVVIAWNLLIARIVLVFKGYLSTNDLRARSLPLKDETADLSADILLGFATASASHKNLF